MTDFSSRDGTEWSRPDGRRPVVGVRLAPRVIEELRRIAGEEERSVSGVIRWAVRDWLARRLRDEAAA